MEKVRLGLIGYGNIGTSHTNHLTKGSVPNMELTAVCDIAEARRKVFADKYPDIPVFESAEDLYKSGLCDAVLIAVPHYDHPRLAIEAFKHDLHVLIEKPAGVYTKQVKEMNEAAAKSDKS